MPCDKKQLDAKSKHQVKQLRNRSDMNDDGGDVRG